MIESLMIEYRVLDFHAIMTMPSEKTHTQICKNVDKDKLRYVNSMTFTIL